MKIIAVLNICVFASGDQKVNQQRKQLYRDATAWRDYLALIPMGRDLKTAFGDLWELIDFKLLSTMPHAYNREHQDDRKEAEFNMRGVVLQDPDIIILLGNEALVVFNEVTLTLPYWNTIYEIPDPLVPNVVLWHDDIRNQIELKRLRNGKKI